MATTAAGGVPDAAHIPGAGQADPPDAMAATVAPAPEADAGEEEHDGDGKQHGGRGVADAVPYFSLYNCDTLDYVAIFLGVIGAVVNGVIFPLFAVVFASLVNTIGQGQEIDIGEMNQITLYFVYLAIATLFASFFEVAMFMWSGQRQTARLRQRYLEAALTQDVAYYDKDATTGDILSGLNDDCTAVQNAISEKVGNVIHHIVTFFVSIGISLYRGWKLALVLLALTPLIAAAGFALARIMTWGSKRMSEGYAKANVTSSQAIGNIRTVASFQAEPMLYDKYVQSLETPTRTSVKIYTFNGIAGGCVKAAIFVTYAVAFWVGAKFVREGVDDYDGGIVMNVVFGAIIGGFSLGQAVPSFSAFFTGRVAGGRIYRVTRRKPAIDAKADGLVLKEGVVGDIALRNVRFSYPARSDVEVFKDFNLEVAAGQTVALVGESGSGKSTAIQLLQRFYDPAAGAVLVDGNDIRTLQLEWLRGQIGLVSQEPTLFATTIRENIRMGRESASDAEIEAAAKSANAARFIEKLPQRYETQVGERGVQLSGGQKQRIAIARALLKNPRVLLLDEATSALDTVSERLVQAALERLAEGRTTVIVAHRLSTIRNADKIAVVKGGVVAEEGTHDILYSDPNSVYHNLVKLQEQAMDKRAETEAKVGLEEDEDAILAESAIAETGQRDSRRRTTVSFGQGERPKIDADGDVPSPLKAKKEDELTEEEKATKVGFRRLIGMNRGEWPYLAAGVAASAALGCVMPLFAYFLGTIIEVFFITEEPLISEYETPQDAFDESKRRARNISLYFLALAVGFFLMASLQGHMFAIVGSRLSYRVRQLFIDAVLHMEMGWFDKDENTSGSLTARLSSDAPTVRGATGDVLGIVVQNLATLAAGFGIAFAFGWEMTLVVLATLPLLGFSSYMQPVTRVMPVRQMKFFTGLDNKAGSVFGAANQTAYEGVSSLRTVHSYNLQHRVTAIYRDLLQESVSKGSRNALSSGASFGIGQGIMFLTYSLSFWFGSRRVESGDMSIQDVFTVFFSILLASMGISQAQMAFPDVAKGGKAVARIFRVVDRRSEIDPRDTEGEVPTEPVRGDVELRDVTFSYPTRPDVVVFRAFNLHAAAGKVTALVGESGSGKSTIVNLVERFYDPAAGQVLLDGRDLRQLRISWLRSQIALVSQEPVLFNGTVLENLRIGRPDATLEQVQAACAVANAAEFIAKQPDAYETLLGEGGGITLSGGQKQRIAIARAMLKDPRVLLLDEATSALDASSERVVQDALEKSMRGRTSIVIAHRLTTIRSADKIAVVQRGSVLEEGSHDELMAKGREGAYAQLARAQAGK